VLDSNKAGFVLLCNIAVLMYSWSMIAAMLSVLVSTLVIGISRYAHAAPPPNFLCTFITFPVTQSILFLPEVKTEVKQNISKVVTKQAVSLLV
jgi:hypothetical protein